MRRACKALIVAALLATGAGPTLPIAPAWTQATAPFPIVGPISYVGTKGLAAYLIATPKGLILIDATLAQNVPAIEANITALGYKLSDVKILLNSHAHFDHADGFAAMKRDTGAKLYAMAGDVWALEHGKHFGDQNYVGTFTPVKVDRILHDGSVVSLGGVTLHAVLTAGHTRGCTTWLMTVTDAGKKLDVVFPGSLTVAGNVLVGNKAYPHIVADYRASFKTLAGLHADVVLPAHPELADVLERKGKNWLAPDVLPKLVTESRTAFEAQLANASPKPSPGR